MRATCGWFSIFFSAIHATFVKVKPIVLSIKIAVVTLVSFLVLFSTSVPQALDAHKRLCTMSFTSNSPLCAPYATINFTVLDLRSPGYTKLSNTSHNLLERSEELRLDAIATSEIRSQVILAHARGAINIPVEDIAGKLDTFTADLRRTSEGARRVSFEMRSFLDKFVAHYLNMKRTFYLHLF